VQLKPFLLDAWLDQFEHDIEFNLAASTGPNWTVNDILALADEQTRYRFLNHKLVYSRPAGADNLREAIAAMQGVPVETVQIVTGASEALVALMWLAAEPGANVIIPLPGFTTFSALPESLGLETRFYRVRRENGFRIDPDEISGWPTRRRSSSWSTAHTTPQERPSLTKRWKLCTTSLPSVESSS
jgi:histidinol-phosphate/aromatic aminotransferase/cobyric acid decarboxylase-like protein